MFLIKDYKSKRLGLKIMNEKKSNKVLRWYLNTIQILQPGLETLKCENK